MTEKNSSNPVVIGEKAPSFQDMLSVDGKLYSLDSFNDKEILIILFMANRCSTVQAYSERTLAIQNDYKDRGLQIVAINSDDPGQFSSEGYLEMIYGGEGTQLLLPIP